MKTENASPQGVTARLASPRRLRHLSTAVVLATVASVGASQGALDRRDGAHRQAVAHEMPTIMTAGIDIGALTAVASIPAQAEKSAERTAHESGRDAHLSDPPAEKQHEESVFSLPLPRHLAYPPLSVDMLADEAARHPQEIIRQFVKSGEINFKRHDGRADLRHIRETIRELASIEGSPDDVLEFEEMKVARWIVDAVRQASAETGVDAVYMMALADKESSLVPDISARTSSAEGLFQFIEQTWLECVETYGAAHGLEAEAEAIRVDTATGRRSIADESERERILNLRRDPLIAGVMAGEMMKRDGARIEAALERELTWHELYMAHFLGAGGAIRLLKLADTSPKKAASKEFPAAARANRNLFFAGKGKGKALTVAQVYERIETMIGPRLERYASLKEEPPLDRIARVQNGPLPLRLRSGG